MKLKDKVRIGSLDSSAYIDFENHMYYFNTNERAIRLNPNEMNILRCLCFAYNENDGCVENYTIFCFINGYEFDKSKNMDMRPITRAISELRKKITKDDIQYSEEYIKSPRRGVFKIILPESPFEIIENSEHENSKAQINSMSTDEIVHSTSNNHETFYTLLKNAYEYLIAYREAFRQINENAISHTTKEIQKIFQKIYLYYERRVYSNSKEVEEAKNIIDKYNKFVELYNHFSNSQNSSEAQQNALLADNEFNSLLQLIIEFISEHGNSNSDNIENDSFISTLDFLDKYLVFSGENKSTGVDLAFYAGTLWLLTDERTEILNQLKEHNISCRIIINEESDIITSVHKHMKNKNKSYLSISDTIKLWYEQQEHLSEILHIKISPLPLLRNYCHIKNINDYERDAMRIFHYTYGNGNLNRDCIQILTNNSSKAEVFADEFEYLWNNSKDIKQYFEDCKI